MFYDNSSFDNPVAGHTVDDAIAPEKQPLMPGDTADFSNYTSYHKGLNGIIIDVVDLEGVPTIQDFVFKVGNDNNTDAWADARDPTSITVRPGEGADGADRITLVWDDHAIDKQWLQIALLADGTGLLEDDVFYFGNAVGESGNSLIDAKVNAFDMLAARDNQHNFIDPAGIDDFVDFNRDQRVNVFDMLIARNNTTHFLNALRLITVAGPGDPAKAVTVPEPAALTLLALGLASLYFVRHRRSGQLHRRRDGPIQSDLFPR